SCNNQEELAALIIHLMEASGTQPNLLYQLPDDNLLMRPKKLPRLTELSDLLLDEAPSRDIHDGPASFNLMNQLLTLATKSIALCRGAHLGSLKLYQKKFLKLCFVKYESASNLRGPTSLEAQAADKRAWSLIAELVNIHAWKLDDTLHEVTQVRADLSTLLAPRAHIPKHLFQLKDTWRPRHEGKGNRPNFRGNGKGGKGKGEHQWQTEEAPERAARGGKGKKGANSSPGKWLSTLFMEGKQHTLCMCYQQGQCKDPSTCRYLHRCAVPKPETRFGDQRESTEVVQAVPLCVPARPAGAQGTLQPQPEIAARDSSAASRAMSASDFSFSTCLSLLEEYFSDAANFTRQSQDIAIAQADAYFNLGAFGFDDGKRVGIFQRTEQFSDIVRFLNSFLSLLFPGSSWSSICVSHNVRTLLHTDAGNQPGSTNFSISLGNFCGGEVWMSPPLNVNSPLVSAPQDSSSNAFSSSEVQLGELIDTFESATAFPCEHIHCTCPFSGDRWVLTAYTCRGLASFTPEQISYIRSLGFPLPGDTIAVPAQQPGPTVQPAKLANTAEPGFFLDVCCGANAPLSDQLYQSDLLCYLRKEWRQWLLEKHIPERLAQHVSEHRDSPLFSESDWDFSVMPDLETAFQRWGKDRVAVGKVNIVKDIQSAFPLREDNEEGKGFSLDVKGAHKTSRVRERDIGLLGMRRQERLLFYRVCPFGATFSSHWFARIGGFFTRLFQIAFDTARPLGANVSVSPTLWAGIGSHLDEELRFTSSPPSSAVCKGSCQRQEDMDADG
ncbi:unnamed protein product, partial [Symbiodinium sp. CCMP2456]